ncbi:hypothetical protein I5M27_13795 [Adhaeribacter sp. BT258]|uniref:histidine kinase n=1 Tax=Adhaeribacter terrigena TaxID=2793070 RepID=A0ABS1C423_9BACT|nr:hypothetical protein [Adhaeribacter terrigena]MBK0404063.1 hypothetical protein [Adhaeribacter terrigena]
MLEYVQNLFESVGFIPHGHSFSWQPAILATNVAGDALTALAFLAIPPVLLFLTKKRKDLTHKYVFIFFALFLFLCSITHLFGIVTVWNPVYRIQGVFKIITGVVSVITAFMLYRALPDLMRIPGQKRLEEVNIKLRKEVAERERAQIALREANEALETRVQQRTAQLIKTNRDLEREIEQRKRTEQDLKEKNMELMRINNSLNQQSKVN